MRWLNIHKVSWHNFSNSFSELDFAALIARTKDKSGKVERKTAEATLQNLCSPQTDPVTLLQQKSNYQLG